MVKRYFIKFINSVKNKKFLTGLFAFSYLIGIILGVVLNNAEVKQKKYYGHYYGSYYG